jgi:hypothetical protein
VSELHAKLNYGWTIEYLLWGEFDLGCLFGWVGQ